MEVLFGIVIGIGGILLVMVLRSFTTLFHEMGHAIPALLFSKEKVQVYIGTYGDTEHGASFSLGRLDIFFKFNFLAWNIGMCRHQGQTNAWRNFLIIVGGPIASLLIAIPLLFFLPQAQAQPLLHFSIFVFVGAAMLDLVSNLFPYGSQMHTDSGKSIYNDGMQLLSLWKRGSLPQVYFEMEQLIAKKNFVGAIEKGKPVVTGDKTKPEVYDLMVQALKQEKEYEDIITAIKLKSQYYELKPSDYHMMGVANTKLNRFNEALKFLNQACYKEYTNGRMLLDRGYLHLQRSDAMAALDDFNAALHFDGSLLQAVVYRGLAMIRLEEADEAIKDLEQVVELKPDYALAWFYLGQAYEADKEDELAFTAYTKAKELGCDEHGLDYRLQLLGD
jgi:hypothetical protein